MTHSHSPAGVDPSKRRLLNGAAGVLAVAIVAALAVLWPSVDSAGGLGDLGFGSEFYDAEVVDIGSAPCAGTDPEDEIRCEDINLRLLQGPDEGSTTSLNFASDNTTTPQFERGDRIIVSRQPDAEPGFEYAFADRHRKPVLLWLAAIFALAVVVLGRLRGLAALAGLAVSFAVLLRFIIPAIVAGDSPLIVAVVGSAAIAFLAITSPMDSAR